MAISVESALEKIYAMCHSPRKEIVPIEYAVQRVLAETIIATHSLPAFDNSAMDGYAVKVSDCGETCLQSHTVFAGDQNEVHMIDHECIRIMTGARIPTGCEAVIPIEEVIVSEEKVTLPSSIRPGSHIRLKGEDIQAGMILLKEGTYLYPHHISLLASQGITHIKLYRRPKVALFSSGNELKMHYEVLGNNQLYNTNTPTFAARAKELGCDVIFTGTAEDTLESMKTHVTSVLDADLIITSGGVSVGDADFTKKGFYTLGFEAEFESVDIKPGKPTTFGHIKNSLVLNLPGNPLAASLCFELFGQSAILALSGRNDKYLSTIKTTMASDFKLKKGRRALIPGWFSGQDFQPLEKFGPGMVLPLSQANGFIMVHEERESFACGDEVQMLSIRWTTSQEDCSNLISY